MSDHRYLPLPDDGTTTRTLDLPRVDTPGGLAALVPYQLGFTPRSSLVAVAMVRAGAGASGTPVRTTAGLARVDLPRTQRALPDVVAALGLCLHPARADDVLVVVHGPDQREPGEPPLLPDLPLEPGALVLDLLDEVRERLDADGVGLLDAIYVEDGRWVSLTCYGEGCCDPWGADLPFPGDVEAVADLVVRGRAPVAGRSDVVATVLAGSDPLAVEVARLLPGARAAQLRRPVTDRTVLRRWREVLLDPVRAREADPRQETALPPAATLARVVAELETDDLCAPAVLRRQGRAGRPARALRDVLLVWVTADRSGLHALPAEVVAAAEAALGPWGGPTADAALLDRACALLRCVPEPDCAPLSGLVAALAWHAGDPVRARVAAEQALRRRPDHTMAQIVLTCLDHAMTPAR